MASPLEQYRALLAGGEFQPDPAQGRAAEALERLYRALAGWTPAKRFFRFSTSATPRGLYLYGPVGRGKSRLMDVFYDSVQGQKKRRVHFNAFMAETHARIHAWRSLSAREKSRSPFFTKDAGDDPIAPAAKRIFAESPLLCFDEFQVTDVADAMILGRLFEQLFHLGAVLVVTSNTPPEELYRGGLNRQLFLPFIALIRERLDVLELAGPRDYRLGRMAGLKLYMTPLGESADAAMNEAWRHMTEAEVSRTETLAVQGRSLIVPQAAKDAARFSFDTLCRAPLGAADYLAIARRFHTVFIDHIPVLKPEERNEARRFILLIDSLYDERVKLVCSAAADPFGLYTEGDAVDAFQRTASRLSEMQSEDYLKLEHRADANADGGT